MAEDRDEREQRAADEAPGTTIEPPASNQPSKDPEFGPESATPGGTVGDEGGGGGPTYGGHPATSDRVDADTLGRPDYQDAE